MPGGAYFSNACAIQITLDTSELLKKTAKNVGYWQKDSEIAKRRLLKTTNGLIRVNVLVLAQTKDHLLWGTEKLKALDLVFPKCNIFKIHFTNKSQLQKYLKF